MHQSVVTVPNLVGKSAIEAQQLAQEAGLELKVKNQIHSDRFPANTVIEQWPRDGMTVKQGQSVQVNVSLGPHDVGQVRLEQ
jgi:beta-lactam-binding protein with PASTA domain